MPLLLMAIPAINWPICCGSWLCRCSSRIFHVLQAACAGLSSSAGVAAAVRVTEMVVLWCCREVQVVPMVVWATAAR